MGIVIVVRFEIIHVKNNGADPFGLHFFGNKRTIRFQGLFVQRPRHHIIIGKLDKIIAHFLNEPVIGGLSKKDMPKGNKTDNNGKTQQEMLE